MIGCRPLSEDEIRLVMKSFWGPWEHRNRLFFVLGYTTGFRVSELLSLKVYDVWRNGRPLDKIRVARRHMKKKISSRSAALAPIARKYLEIWIGQLSLRFGDLAGVALFAGRKHTGTAISRIQAYRIIRDSFDACELCLTNNGIHTLRKTYADRVFRAMDENIFKVQKALGHASPASTVAYLSFQEEELDQAVATIWSQPEETR